MKTTNIPSAFLSAPAFFMYTFCLLLGLTNCSANQPENLDEKIPTIDVVEYTKMVEDMMAKYRTSGFADSDKGRKDTLMMMATALKGNNFDTVIKIGNEYISQYEMDNEVQYMLATALFQQGEYGKAAKHYIDLTKEPDFMSTRKAKYYLALCYLRFDNQAQKASALRLLEQLQADPGEEFDAKDLQGLIDLFS